MSTSYYNIALSSIDSNGNPCIVYPKTKASNVIMDNGNSAETSIKSLNFLVTGNDESIELIGKATSLEVSSSALRVRITNDNSIDQFSTINKCFYVDSTLDLNIGNTIVKLYPGIYRIKKLGSVFGTTVASLEEAKASSTWVYGGANAYKISMQSPAGRSNTYDPEILEYVHGIPNSDIQETVYVEYRNNNGTITCTHTTLEISNLINNGYHINAVFIDNGDVYELNQSLGPYRGYDASWIEWVGFIMHDKDDDIFLHSELCIYHLTHYSNTINSKYLTYTFND